jgi:CheY-like chemotaxis protein
MQLRSKTARCRVLIVEDHVDTAQALGALLELDEHTVALTHSGEEALRRAREFLPDVVLCDIGLPNMNGYDVARAMRSDPLLRKVVLVALSGYAQCEDVRSSKEAGFDEHLAKPPDIDDVVQVLARVGARA